MRNTVHLRGSGNRAGSRAVRELASGSDGPFCLLLTQEVHLNGKLCSLFRVQRSVFTPGLDSTRLRGERSVTARTYRASVGMTRSSYGVSWRSAAGLGSRSLAAEVCSSGAGFWSSSGAAPGGRSPSAAASSSSSLRAIGECTRRRGGGCCSLSDGGGGTNIYSTTCVTLKLVV